MMIIIIIRVAGVSKTEVGCDFCFSLCQQNADVLRPPEPQGYNLPAYTVVPTFSSSILDQGINPLQPAPSDPTLTPAVQPSSPDRTHPAVSDPATVINPSKPRGSSSSESAEGPYDSSSEEIGGPVALRPPINFRYQRHERKKRQALMRASHNPVFLTDFPSGFSPFRSCPGPSRYTTV